MKQQPKTRKINIRYLPVEIQNKFIGYDGFIYYTFDKREEEEWKEVTLNKENAKGLIKPFINYNIVQYFKAKGKIVVKNFIDSIEIWSKRYGQQKFNVFDKFSLKIIGQGRHNLQFGLLISYEGEASVSKTPFSEFHETTSIKNVLYRKKLIKISRDDEFDLTKSFPILTNTTKRELVLQQ